MNTLVLVPIVVAAVGTDLGLSLLVLGLLFTWGAAPPELGSLAGLSTPWVLGVAAGVWLLETILEQLSLTVLALWHTAQVVARPVAALLLAGAILPSAPTAVALGLPLVAVLACLAVHAGAVGWLAFLHLAAVPGRARWVASFAEDAAVIALLALGLDHPLPALGLLVVLALAAPHHHLTSLAGFQLLVRGVVGDARGLLSRGGWQGRDTFPRWVLRRLEALEIKNGDARGTAGALQGPEASRLRYGWFVVTRSTRVFLPRIRGEVMLNRAAGARVEEDRIVTRVRLPDGFTLHLPPDGPDGPELAVEFDGTVVTDGSQSL